ncbi:MAG TPA: polyprenyl synthetase [Blastocatellia bacterium]|jgi:geranylgeranyl pyrophosphate synthase|nr:polyprenyl synthetase [Blastocatellia bacterium]HAF22097.1 polyprenyl synthetase [Blastocatellia bacterium]
MKTFSETPATANDSNLQSFVSETRSLVDAELDRLLPAESVSPAKVHAAIRWSMFAGGKRFRPLLVLAVGKTFGAAQEHLLATACALEMVHTYSLIHDDLPSMDNDELRRGRATCHIRFGEATAILAGDALQTIAFKTLSEDEKLSAVTRVHLIREIARASGTPHGMVAGQAGDLEAESREVGAQELENIHRLKTGALIIAAARCGAIIAGASETELAAVTDYAAQLGLLFQITDDLLDVTATAEAIGKTPGKDQRSKKATYPALYGIEATRQQLPSAHQSACASLDTLPRSTELLRAIADSIVERRA